MMTDEIHSFFHCMRCHRSGQTERLQVGLTASGVRVDCTKHGIVWATTPEELPGWLANGPECDCCRRGACSEHASEGDKPGDHGHVS